MDPKKRLTVDQALDHQWVRTARETLAARNLHENLRTFRAFQGRQKFRAGVKALIAAQRLKAVLRKLKHESLKIEDINGGIKEFENTDGGDHDEQGHWKDVDPQQVEVTVE